MEGAPKHSTRRFGGVLAIAALGLQLAACASLPKEQATAFKTLASSTRTAFASLSGAQADAIAAEPLAAAGDGRKRVDLAPACLADDSAAEPCSLVIDGIDLGSHTQRLQALLAGVDAYASGMNDLAAAKDLDDAAEATGKVRDGLKSLAGLLGPPIGPAAGPVLDALAFGDQSLRIRQRREAMRRLAQAADKVLEGTAAELRNEVTQLRGSLLDARKIRLRQALHALDVYNAKPDTDTDKARQDRTRLIAAVSSAATAVTQARAIRTDFTPLSLSNRALLVALGDRHADLTASVAEAKAFQDALATLTNLKPAAGGNASPGGDPENDDGSH